MFGRSRRPQPKVPRETSVPPETVVWAIGDIHGQDDLFESLISAVEADLAKSDKRRVVILLGDYIDRGLGSAKVVDRIFSLRDALAKAGVRLVLLKGNHEDLLLRFIDDPATGPAWMNVGGSETLLAYGIQPPATNDTAGWLEASNRLLSTMPLDHLTFYEDLDLQYQEGDFHFVHAGVRPGASLDQQAPEDLLWIRDSFLKDTRPLEKVIVHGHTPGPDVFADHRRICLDTGSYATGLLTGLRLEGSTRLLLQSRRGRDRIELEARPLGDETALLA